MPKQYQCRFCPKSYNEVLEFLDHFDTHMNKDQTEAEENGPKNGSHEAKSLKE